MANTNSEPSDNLYAHLLGNAKKARRAIQDLNELTKKAASDNQQIIFVFDTDVIMTYCAPWMVGPVGNNYGQGYGQLLPSRINNNHSKNEVRLLERTERQTAENVAKLLAKCAIEANKLDNQQYPLVQLTEHYQETQKVFKTVKSRVDEFPNFKSDETNWHVNRRLLYSIVLVRKYLQEETKKEGFDKKLLAEKAAKYALKAVRQALDDQKPRRKIFLEWENFYQLNCGPFGIFTLDDFASQIKFKNRKNVIDLLNQKPDQSERNIDLIIAKALNDRINQTKNRNFSETINTDAKALAELALINRRISENNVPVKFVLITGDHNLIKSLKAGNAADEDKEVREIIGKFAKPNVQHLWGFLGPAIDEAISSSGNYKQTSSVENYFDGLLAIQKTDGNVDYKNETYDEDLEKAYDVEKVYSDWDLFTQRLDEDTRLTTLNSEEANEPSEISKAVLEEINKSIEKNEPHIQWTQLHGKVEDVIELACDVSNVTLSAIGGEMLMAAHHNGERNPPDLMFDSFQNTNGIFEKLASPRRHYENDSDFNIDFDNIKNDWESGEGDLRPVIYLKYLVLGALVASANRWDVVKEHAKNAIDIVERGVIRQNKIIKIRQHNNTISNLSGREAYYLLACAEHASANRKKHFRKAEEALQKARDCLFSDRNVKSAKSISPIRFDNEQLAIDLSKYYFKRKDRTEVKLCVAELKKIDKSLSKVLKVSRKLQKAQDRSAKLENDLESGVKEYDKLSRTRVSIACNIIQCKVIATFAKGNVPKSLNLNDKLSDELLENALNDIYRFTNIRARLTDSYSVSLFDFHIRSSKSASVICTDLILRYAAAAGMLLKTEKNWYPKEQRDLEILFQNEKNVTGYDEWRYGMLKDFLVKLL